MTTCAQCPEPAANGHHPTGRVNGVYLDAEFTVPLCLRCHAADHARRRILGLEGRRSTIPADLSLIEQVELALRRTASSLGTITAPGWVAALARAMCRWADLLASAVTALDQHHPGWRESSAAIPKGA